MRKAHAAAYRRPPAFAADSGQRTTDRRGFTLVELLVVILILAILIAFLVPAIQGAVVSAKEGRVRTEISQFDTAIAQFRSTLVDFAPPSRITLFEQADQWFANTAEAKRSRQIIGKIWPQFNFSMPRDIDGDGTPNEANPDSAGGPGLTLTGAECLVFFLGGPRRWDNGQTPPKGLEMMGFAKNPADPLSRTDQNRHTPFFEFDIDRLDDVDDDRMSEFVDTLAGQTTPYLYVSSSFGGYNVLDLVVFPDATKNMSALYRQGSTATSPVWNDKSFQIISAGYDHEYGAGGEYDPERAGNLLSSTARRPEQDNLTNFHEGRLAN